MAWLTIRKQGQEVKFLDGTEFALGSRVLVGRSLVELRSANGRGMSVARLRCNGDAEYVTPLHRDGLYRVGDDHCFRLVEASEERDPVICALRLAGVSPNILQRLEGDELFAVRLFDCDLENAAPGTATVSVLTDGNVREALGQVGEAGPRKRVMAAPGTYAIELVRRKLHSGLVRGIPERVAVWPGCTCRELAMALVKAMVGDDGLTPGYLEALSSFEAAKVWVKNTYAVEPHPTDGELLLVNGRDFSLERNDAEPAALERIKSLHGWGVLRDYFGPAQLDYLAAKRDEIDAAEYIRERCSLGGLSRGDERFLKLSLAGQEGPPTVYAMGHLPPRNGPFLELFARHWGLVERLFRIAHDKVELVAFHPTCQGYDIRSDVWHVKCRWSTKSRFDEWRPIANREDAVEVQLDDVRLLGALTDLTSGVAEALPGTAPENVHACLQCGDEAYATGNKVLLLLGPNDTGTFVFLVKYAEVGRRVVGFTVTRCPERLDFAPYKPLMRYALTGQRDIDVVPV